MARTRQRRSIKETVYTCSFYCMNALVHNSIASYMCKNVSIAVSGFVRASGSVCTSASVCTSGSVCGSGCL